MLNQFLLPTIGFVVNVLSSLAAFTISWLIFDSRGESLKKKDYYKFLQCFGFLILGVYVLMGRSFDFTGILDTILNFALIGSLFMILVGYYYEPTPILSLRNEKKKTTQLAYKPNIILAIIFAVPLFFVYSEYYYLSLWTYLLLIWVLLLFKFRVGKQRQLKKLVVAFFCLLLASLALILDQLFATDLRFEIWTAQYGLLWFLELALTFFAFMNIGSYAYSYLRFRLKPQIFINFLVFSLLIFFSVTVVFLLVLLKDFEENTLFNLKSSNKAVEIALVDERNNSILAAKALANNGNLINSVEKENHSEVAANVKEIFETSNADSIIVTNEAGISLYESSNPNEYGSNLSSDKFFLRALEGNSINTLASEEGILAPLLLAKTYLPIVKDNNIIGALEVAYFIDDEFVSSLKKQTNLETALFVGNVRSATTFTFDNGNKHFSGTVEENPEVIETVLNKGEVYEGVTTVFNVEYLCVYYPLKDDDGNIIGMIFVGEPSLILKAIAQQSIQTTLKWMSLLVLLSLIPTYFFAKRSVMSQMV